MYKNGDIVLVKFPFSDLKNSKVRPAVVISSDEVCQDQKDPILLFISSVMMPDIEAYELVFLETHVDFKKSGLKKKSVFKPAKLATVERKFIRKKLGTLGDQIRKELREITKNAIRI